GQFRSVASALSRPAPRRVHAPRRSPGHPPVCSGCEPISVTGLRVSRPTIHDVAKAAGVSVTTVSHALNGKGRVDPATRARVAQVVGTLGYRANRHAQGLRSGRSGALGLLLPVAGAARSDETLRLHFYMRA